MCGRFTLHASKETLTQQFGLDFGEVLPRYNLAPTERIRMIFSNANEERQAGSPAGGWYLTGARRARRTSHYSTPAARRCWRSPRSATPSPEAAA